MTIWAILLAAGIGRRMGSSTPKQYLPVSGVPVISHTLGKLLAFADLADLAKIVVALHPADARFAECGFATDDRIETTTGGGQRQQSVLNALAHLKPRAAAEDWVLVHDAVRPCVPVTDIEALLLTLKEHGVGGLLGTPVDHTLKRVDGQGAVRATVDRSRLWQALTPQLFRYGLLLEAMEKAVTEYTIITDEAAAVEALGHAPQIVEGSKLNIKITHEADLALARMILQQQRQPQESP